MQNPTNAPTRRAAVRCKERSNPTPHNIYPGKWCYISHFPFRISKRNLCLLPDQVSHQSTTTPTIPTTTTTIPAPIPQPRALPPSLLEGTFPGPLPPKYQLPKSVNCPCPSKNTALTPTLLLLLLNAPNHEYLSTSANRSKYSKLVLNAACVSASPFSGKPNSVTHTPNRGYRARICPKWEASPAKSP